MISVAAPALLLLPRTPPVEGRWFSRSSSLVALPCTPTDVLVDGIDPASRLEPVRPRRGRTSVLLAAVEAVRSR